jgi:AAHS family 4-hydroxybenzoate transporter-like MFS transporter
MSMAEQSDLEAVIDSSPLSPYQLFVIALCALVAMMDGFDTQSVAFVAPEITRIWGVAPSAFGAVFGAGLFGGLIGAMIFGIAGDRLGRKPTLIAGVLIFAVGSLVTSLVDTMGDLIVVRFATGLGLGGSLPSFIALASDYAPRRLRATLVAIMFCGFPLGAVIGGIASAQLIPVFGWTSVFLLGAVLPLAVLPVFVLCVAESLHVLAAHDRAPEIHRILVRMGCAAQWNGTWVMRERPSRMPAVNLFSQGRATGTLLLWLSLFLSLLLTYFLINWLPIVARQTGHGIQSAVLAVAMLNLGAVVGCVIIGRLADWLGQAKVIGWAYALGAVFIGLIGYAGHSGTQLLATTFIAGFFSIGAQMCTVALCTSFYDSAIRATGVGWAMGVGRIGAIAGPVLGGYLIGTAIAVPTLFLIAGLISLGAAATLFVLRFSVLRPGAETAAAGPRYSKTMAVAQAAATETPHRSAAQK